MFNFKDIKLSYIFILLICFFIITAVVYYIIYNNNQEYFECNKKDTSLLLEFYNNPGSSWSFNSRTPEVLDTKLITLDNNIPKECGLNFKITNNNINTKISIKKKINSCLI